MSYPPCYCIAGHGRSGSSLVAALFQSGGVDVGRRLMAGNPSNPRGHFEDLDFYDLHVAALAAHGLRTDGFVEAPGVPVTPEFVAGAVALAADRRAAGRPWGWKEPRTTLFLDAWADLVPELRFVFLVRPPWAIIDSLFRRGDEVYREQPALAVRVLANYNRLVLDFHARHPARSVFVESVAAAADPARFAAALADRFGDRLPFAAGVYEPDLIRREAPPAQRRLLAHFFPEVVDQYHRMRARAALAAPELPAADDPADLDFALRHWVDLRAAEGRQPPAAPA